MNALISIIIPVKNGANYLEEALACIERQGMNVEVIVVDDGSEDATAALAEKHGCTVLRHERSCGPVAAKNTGLHAARGSYILFHDHDDRLRENALQTLYEALAEDESIAAVEAKVQDFFSPELTDAQRKEMALKAEPYFGLFTGAVLMRKAIFDRIGDFPATLQAGERIDWEYKMKQHGLKIRKLNFVSAERRVHTANFGRTRREQEFRDYAAILRARLGPKRS